MSGHFLGATTLCCQSDADNYSHRGAFDISLIASIASHLSYWSDEDINHFMLAQMLSRKRRHKARQPIDAKCDVLG